MSFEDIVHTGEVSERSAKKVPPPKLGAYVVRKEPEVMSSPGWFGDVYGVDGVTGDLLQPGEGLESKITRFVRLLVPWLVGRSTPIRFRTIVTGGVWHAARSAGQTDRVADGDRAHRRPRDSEEVSGGACRTLWISLLL